MRASHACDAASFSYDGGSNLHAVPGRVSPIRCGMNATVHRRLLVQRTDQRDCATYSLDPASNESRVEDSASDRRSGSPSRRTLQG